MMNILPCYHKILCKKIFKTIALITIVTSTNLAIAQGESPDWPVLKRYDQNHLARIALPIGGIGTGTVSLGGIGDLRDWEIVNRPAKGFLAGTGGNSAPFFAIYLKPEDQKPTTRALLGPVDYSLYESKDGRKPPNHGLPRFRHCSFAAAYPFGQVYFFDEDVPVDICLKAFNPFIPADPEASGIPIAILRYVVTNKSSDSVETALCASMSNFIGMDGKNVQQSWTGGWTPVGAKQNQNQFRKEDDFQGVYMFSEGVDSASEQWGTMAIVVLSNENVTYRTTNTTDQWGNALLDFWDDFSSDGLLEERQSYGADSPRASLAVNFILQPKQTKEITFLLTWHFPNRFAWASSRLGNYYTKQYKDAWDVVLKTLPKLPELEQRTIKFVDSFCQSDLPECIKEAALFNLSTLRTQTCFRTEDGRFYGWEGCHDNAGCCMGSCTHVWNYEQATAFIFADLAKSMREIEFGHATDKTGLMSFRVSLPLKEAQSMGRAAADGQMGTIMRLYRDWQLSGDDAMLKALWPRAKKALEFCWMEGGWDGDIDGVMEGCQHNTMDVEYYGPNPQMQLWYLGALRAIESIAQYLGERDFANDCRYLFEKGRIWTDQNLFNGEYYIHEIRPPLEQTNVAPSLLVGMGASDLTSPNFQLGEGCLVDQLVGQYMAHICNLGYLVKPENVKKTLNSIYKYNYRESMFDHFNCMRSYALGGESALLMASYPKSRPKYPFPYFTEVMTGFEYTAAIGMLYENQIEQGLHCIENIRARYDGLKRSPFDEAECGHHYARAMASWAAVLAWTGFNYSAVTSSLQFNPKDGNYFWSNGHAFGNIIISSRDNMKHIDLAVIEGQLSLKTFILNDYGKHEFEQAKKVHSGDTFGFEVSKNDPNAGSAKYQSRNVTEIVRPVQIVTPENKRSFTDQIKIQLKCETENVKIHYTLDGSEPTGTSSLYTGPFIINESTTVKSIAFKENKKSIVTREALLNKISNYQTVKLKYPASPLYSGKGEYGLVDGMRGSKNFRDGNWLGFEEDDIELIIDFGKKKSVNKITIGLLQDVNSWIFLPVSIEFAKSDDGVTFNLMGHLTEQEIKQNVNGPIWDIHKKFVGQNTRYLKIHIENRGTCPPGHPGAGGKAWLFVDEIMIE